MPRWNLWLMWFNVQIGYVLLCNKFLEGFMTSAMGRALADRNYVYRVEPQRCALWHKIVIIGFRTEFGFGQLVHDVAWPHVFFYRCLVIGITLGDAIFCAWFCCQNMIVGTRRSTTKRVVGTTRRTFGESCRKSICLGITFPLRQDFYVNVRMLIRCPLTVCVWWASESFVDS